MVLTGEELVQRLKENPNLINDKFFVFTLKSNYVLCSHIEPRQHHQYYRIYGYSLLFKREKSRYYAFSCGKGFESSSIEMAYEITKEDYKQIVGHLQEANHKISDYILSQPSFVGKPEDTRYIFIAGEVFSIIPFGLKQNPDYEKKDNPKARYGKSKYIYYSDLEIAVIRVQNTGFNWNFYPPKTDNELGKHKTKEPGRIYSDNDFKEIPLKIYVSVVDKIVRALDSTSKRINEIISTKLYMPI